MGILLIGLCLSRSSVRSTFNTLWTKCTAAVKTCGSRGSSDEDSGVDRAKEEVARGRNSDEGDSGGESGRGRRGKSRKRKRKRKHFKREQRQED